MGFGFYRDSGAVLPEDFSAQYSFSPLEDFKFKPDDGAILAPDILSRMPWRPRLQLFGARSTTNILPDRRLDFFFDVHVFLNAAFIQSRAMYLTTPRIR